MSAISFQEKLINHLVKITEDNGLEFVKNGSYANFGTVYLQHGFETVLSFFYHFDSNCVKFQFFSQPGQIKMAWGHTPDNCLLDLVLDISSLPSGLKKIENLISSKSIKNKNLNKESKDETIVFATLK